MSPASDALRKTVLRTVEQHCMLLPGERVLVAFSGGPDSICLLDVLEELRSTYSLTLCLAHFNHRLREKASDDDAAFAEETATRRKLAFITSAADVAAYAGEKKLSVEDAARRLRYEFLLRSALSLRASKIAVGHHADDQAETVLMRLLRGSGPHGLAGIPPVRRLGASDEPTIIRPLINVWRTDIMRYVEKHKLPYRTDETNESSAYLRNKIRRELIPQLEREYNPQIRQRLVATAESLAGENDFVKTEARMLAHELTMEHAPRWVVFDAVFLAGLHPALRKRVFLSLVSLAEPQPPMLDASHHADADSIICRGGGRLDLPGKLRLEVSEGAGLISGTDRHSGQRGKAVELSIDGLTMVPAYDLVVSAKVMESVRSPQRLARLCTPRRQYFDLDAVRLPLEIRCRRPGDSFKPLGARGSKKLKDFFVDKKIPRFLRDHIPLLISKDRIMWIMGHAIDRQFMLKPATTAALRVDYETRES